MRKLGDFCLKRILYWFESCLELLSACNCCSLFSKTLNCTLCLPYPRQNNYEHLHFQLQVI